MNAFNKMNNIYINIEIITQMENAQIKIKTKRFMVSKKNQKINLKIILIMNF